MNNVFSSPLHSRLKVHTLESISRLSLLALAIHTRYRGFPGFSQEDHEKILRYELASAIKSGGTCVSLHSGSTVSAVCAIAPLPWDTCHFGIPMLNMKIAAAPNCRISDIVSLFKGSVESLNDKQPPLHISCEIDIDQYNCLNALISLGAQILDLKREYRWISLKNIVAPKFLSRVRDYQPSDRQAVVKIFQKSLFESRFSRDSSLDPDKVVRLYHIWLEKLLEGNEDDRIAVVREGANGLQACGIVEKQDLTAAGINTRLLGNGLYASGPKATGSYYAVIYALAERSLARSWIAQTTVSLNNLAATRVLERMNAGAESRRYALRLNLHTL